MKTEPVPQLVPNVVQQEFYGQNCFEGTYLTVSMSIEFYYLLAFQNDSRVWTLHPPLQMCSQR